jgi:acyl-[acyl-carrier-protein]-phospholipid O-acyltransferase / long-chain-fatty-acid--[acyl-carrier-protein] ligase
LPEPISPYDPKRARRSLFGALLDARKTHGGSRPILVDGDGRTLTYTEVVRAALALGRALTSGTEIGEAIGVLLPTGLGSVIAVYALSAYGRVPAMLNFTAGQHSVTAALKAAKIKRIVTAHRFIELGKYEALEGWLKEAAELVYLEKVRERISAAGKALAALGSFLPGLVAASPSPDTAALILFTSGTEGEPKGVALSHANILTNVEQVRAHIEFFPGDVVFNPLPTFHSFGLTVGALMPLCLGLKTVLHPTPRQPHEIVKRIADYKATILLATDTFVSQYARAADESELQSLRMAVCGAERLREETRQLVKRRTPAELLEGYGVTEAAPVIAANQPGANRAGTVGHPMAGMECRIEPVEGIAGAGRLFVRGANVMLGYLNTQRPGEIIPPPDGWHDTGDVVELDEDGYIAIRGRLKRFAKIGGESVSLSVVENCACALWPDFAHAAIALPDGRRGENIVLVTTNAEAGRDAFIAWAREHGVTELAAPRRIVAVAEIPILGTGKTDYPSVTKIAAKALETPSPGIQD